MSGSIQPDPLFPIDDSEEFKDPFSDLNLFLVKKIRGSLDKHGSGGSWSSHIQTELMEKILPEFRQSFPRYRLGVSALRKVWEKVSYYYAKVQGESGAVHLDGKLNVDYLIRENLKTASTSPDYQTAHEIALRISECIASFEGERPHTDELTKLIWGIQRHLTPSVGVQKIKNPFEEYSPTDKLIVKTLVEITSETPYLSRSALTSQIHKQLDLLRTFTRRLLPTQLYTLAASRLAHLIYPSLSYVEEVEFFILNQIRLIEETSGDLDESLQLETVQRIMALYPLSAALPDHIDLEDLREAIWALWNLSNGSEEVECPQIDPALFALISAELHFIKRKQCIEDYGTAEQMIEETILGLKSLPCWDEEAEKHLETIIWKLIGDSSSFSKAYEAELIALIDRELAHVLIESPHTSFHTAIYQVVQLFKTMSLALAKGTPSLEKIEQWSSQSDLVIAHLHFDTHTPLLKLLTEEWHLLQLKRDEVDHHAFVSHIQTCYLMLFPGLASFSEAVKTRVWILYKYIWYHMLGKQGESSFYRWIRWNYANVGMSGRVISEELIGAMEKTAALVLPLIPFDRKSVRRFLETAE